jgi:hypothetical protein
MTTTQQQPKVQMMGIKIKAKINLTADDWQLYSAMSGRETAARRMNRAIEKKLAKGEICSLLEVLTPYAKWGSMDSESYHTVYEILRRLGLDDDKFI